MNCCKFLVFNRRDDIKIPFYTVLGPLMRRNRTSLQNICSFPMLNVCSLYAGLLGILGTTLSLFDIIRVVKCGSVLPSSLWRTRIQAGKVVTAECERDLKLISLVLSLEYYLLLIFGTLTQHPVLFLPWLILYAFIILIEFTVFICRLFVKGFNVSKHGLILSMFVVYNWLSIFCAFFHLTNGDNM